MFGKKKIQYWYNTRTGEVERGKQSPANELLGPFETADQALHAYDRLRANAAAWAEEDAREEAERNGEQYD
ncbi:SPOR domain-containing protein [uncultured Gulosibacter sp.]|uniref:SPOR domain-containing protein n=1 Tax=uncultured Gulosibacter sp. TaxID=1339167 RepID=UPI002889CEC0|nr:SPOR domain-containing protein [uncultured Gulosibacter sp.]